MSFARVNHQSLVMFPYTYTQLAIENPFTKFDDRFSLSEWFAQTSSAAETGDTLHRVYVDDRPLHDETTEELQTSSEPYYADDKWRLGWVIVPKTQDPLAI
jgi:hypothetical protein